MKKRSGTQGFTLVELAISLMIIGLLIGGILKGKELAQNARDVQLVRQINGYEAAVRVFKSTYDAVPGDMIDAQARIPGCSADPCLNGDGNQYVLAVLSGAWHNDVNMFVDNTLALTTESRKFWVHLSRAGMVTGVDDTRVLSGTYSNMPGVEMPKAVGNTVWAVAGYLNAASWGDASGFMPGNYITLRSVTDYLPPITTRTARYIDRKRDDGKPGMGDVRAPYSATCINGSNEYNIANSNKVCFIAARMQ